jgi:hypothetical protein
MCYLALEVLKGFSAIAINMYVPALALKLASLERHLKPLLNMSMSLPVNSASEVFACNASVAALYVLREVSYMNQLAVPDEVDLIRINLGLNPQYTKGPSVLPLPV